MSQRLFLNHSTTVYGRTLLLLLLCHAPVSAGPEEVMTGRIAIANAELMVNECDVAILQQRVQSLDQLHRQQYASWIEVTTARAELFDQMEALEARRNYAAWIRRQTTRIDRLEPTSLAQRNDIFIHLQIPESQAVLGWVNICKCSLEIRRQLLDLVEARVRLLSGDPFGVAVAQTRIAALEETLSKLAGGQGSAAEVNLLKLQLSSALAKRTLCELRHALDLAEQEQLLNRIANARRNSSALHTVQESNNRESDSQPYDAWQIAILESEATATGAIEVARSLQKWSESTHAAILLLEKLGFASSRQIANTRSIEQNLTSSEVTIWDRLQFLQSMSGALAASHLRHNSELLLNQNYDEFELSDEILLTPHLLEMACNTYRDRVLLEARLRGLENRISLHRDLMEQLMAQSSVNSHEMEQADLMLSLLKGQQRQIEEGRHVLRLVQFSIADLNATQCCCAFSHSRIKEQACRVILLSAQQSRDMAINQSLHSEHMAENAKQQLASMQPLYVQGYASRNEILELKILQNELSSVAAQHRLKAHRSDIDGQLAEVVFRSVGHCQN